LHHSPPGEVGPQAKLTPKLTFLYSPSWLTGGGTYHNQFYLQTKYTQIFTACRSSAFDAGVPRKYHPRIREIQFEPIATHSRLIFLSPESAPSHRCIASLRIFHFAAELCPRADALGRPGPDAPNQWAVRAASPTATAAVDWRTGSPGVRLIQAPAAGPQRSPPCLPSARA